MRTAVGKVGYIADRYEKGIDPYIHKLKKKHVCL